MTEDKMREAFEAWMSNNGEWPQAVESGRDGYKLMQTASAWNVWQAATASQAQEIEALRADAERYRWLRVQHEGEKRLGLDITPLALAFTVFMPWQGELVPVGCVDGELDEAIDEAIHAMKEDHDRPCTIITAMAQQREQERAQDAAHYKLRKACQARAVELYSELKAIRDVFGGNYWWPQEANQLLKEIDDATQ